MNALNPGRLGVDCVVEREWTVEDRSSDLPAVGHLAEGSRVDRRWYLSGDGFDRGENRNTRLAKADLREQIDRVLNNIAFGVEVGKDIDRSISDEQCFRVRRHIHDEHVAYPPFSTQTCG